MVSQPSTINYQLLQQHFATLAETPDAGAKLRDFVLGLAVRGQLLPQRSEDEKHTHWQEFAAKFARADTRESDEPPFDTPKSWRWVRLDDVADYAAADKVDPSEIKAGDWVLDLEEIEKDSSRIVRIARFAEKQSSSTKAKFLPGDVLYGKLRPYLNKVVVAPQFGYCTTEIVPIRSRGLIEPGFLCLYLRSPDFVGYANSKSYGMKMPRLGTDDAVSAWVAVPPPAEQKRIVAKVEELLALCAELEVRQAAAREHRTNFVRSALNHLATAQNEAEFKQYSVFCLQHSELLFNSVPTLRQAIIDLAYQGHLTERFPSDGDGLSLRNAAVAGSETELSKREMKRGANAEKDSECEPLFTAPSNWCWTRLRFLCDQIGDIDHKMPKAVASGVPFLSAKDLKDDGTLDFSDPKHISEEDYKRLSRKIIPRRGDIVYSRIGARLGKARLVEVDTKFLISYSCCLIRPKLSVVEARFLQRFLDSHLALDQAQTGTQSIGVPDLGLGEIKAYRIPLPPLAEQKRIVAKVDELMRWCDALEARLTAAQTSAEHLLDATLHHILTA